MQVESIKRFLTEHYSDEKLAALKAHCEDGKFNWHSTCNCLLGMSGDYRAAKYCDGFEIESACAAEREVFRLGTNNAERAEKLLPLIREEQQAREFSRYLLEPVEVTA